MINNVSKLVYKQKNIIKETWCVLSYCFLVVLLVETLAFDIFEQTFNKNYI